MLQCFPKSEEKRLMLKLLFLQKPDKKFLRWKTFFRCYIYIFLFFNNTGLFFDNLIWIILITGLFLDFFFLPSSSIFYILGNLRNLFKGRCIKQKAFAENAFALQWELKKIIKSCFMGNHTYILLQAKFKLFSVFWCWISIAII